jgi:hypothetical protein
MHGDNEKFAYDWSDRRGRAEQLGRWCLVSCLDWAATNAANDNPEAMAT